MSNIRNKRINSEIQRNLSQIIDKLKNPEVTAMVSVTRVEVSGDLKYAKVWLSIYGAAEESVKTFQAVLHSTGYIRHELAAMMRDMRILPELIFLEDDSAEYSAKINQIINEIKTDKK